MLVSSRRRAAATVVRAADPYAAYAKDLGFAGGLVGGKSAFGDYNFDPLNLSDKCFKFLPYFREAELKHGRVAMLAWVGLVVPEIVRIPGKEACYTASVVDAHKMCTTDATGAQVGPMLQILMLCGIIEMTTTFPKIVSRDGLTLENAGDYRLGLNFLPKEADKATEMRLKELKNGRLAMLAFGGAITQAVLTGNGFPWLYAERQACGPSLAGSIPAAPRSTSRTSMCAEPTTGGYKMSKAVPFLPMSPALEGYPGEEDGFDPMGVSLAIDVRWLRESELKHGRVAMLAVVGWIATDVGLRVPGDMFQVSTIEAHDAMVKFGSMPQMLCWMGFAELFGFLAITNMMEGTTDRQPGDFGLRALYPKDEAGQLSMQMKELRNGRLAMLAFGGIATTAVLTGGTWPFFATQPEKSGTFGKGSTFCGAKSAKSGAETAVRAMETSSSLPFLPKPKNLAGYVGAEQEFDPLGFSDTFDMRWLRESELKHGRVCMMATVGFFAQQFITLPGCTPAADSLQAVYTAPQAGMATLLFIAGYIESASYNGKLTMVDMFEDSDRVPGDLNFGSKMLNGKDEKAVNDMKLKELNNGRLAMCAIGGMVHHNLVVKGPLFPLFPEGWVGPQGSWGLETSSIFGAITNGQIGNEVVPP